MKKFKEDPIISIITCGGTLDKITPLHVGLPVIEDILKHTDVKYEIHKLMSKDSLVMSEADRDTVARKVLSLESDRIIVTHGTDKMHFTARNLVSLKCDKTIVITGSMVPYIDNKIETCINIGYALHAVQSLPYGVYAVMHGQVFPGNDFLKTNGKLFDIGKYSR